jgi:hypothetical protein
MLSQQKRIRFRTQEQIRGHAAGFISLGGFCSARRSMFGCVPLGRMRFSGLRPPLAGFSDHVNYAFSDLVISVALTLSEVQSLGTIK